MEKIQMERLLVYKDNKVYLDNVDLAKLTNMYYMSEYEFLQIMRVYFRNKLTTLNNGYGAYIINNNEKDIYEPFGDTYKITYKVEGEMLVDKKAFKDYKKQIFDFAYTKCSSLADLCCRKYILKEVDEVTAQHMMEHEYDTYTCFYRASGKIWNYLESDIKIDREEQNKMFEILNYLSEKEKSKILKK